jgi:hypothetical protein
MSTASVVALVLIVLAALLVVAVIAVRKRRSSALRAEFGPEYDRADERDLRARKEEHEQLTLRDLTPAARQRFTDAWASAQSSFVDTPALALTQADTLVTQLLTERGYPVDDFDTKARLLSVDHSDVMDSYRAAHEVEVANQAGTAGTEAIRNAFLDFRQVFETVLAQAGGPAEAYPAEDVEPRRRRAASRTDL